MKSPIVVTVYKVRLDQTWYRVIANSENAAELVARAAHHTKVVESADVEEDEAGVLLQPVCALAAHLKDMRAADGKPPSVTFGSIG